VGFIEINLQIEVGGIVSYTWAAKMSQGFVILTKSSIAMTNVALVALAAWLLVADVANSFYLPGVAPRNFGVGEVVPLKVSSGRPLGALPWLGG
jgi:hypothetical protein